jgi:hypothetical protein
LTHWDIRYEMATNIALACGIFAVLVWQVRRTEQIVSNLGVRWSVPALSLIVFSLSQYENWLWGWQLQMLLNVLAVIGGATVLANYGETSMGFGAAALLGMVATYSFANGILFWPVGLGVLFLAMKPGKRKTSFTALWALISTLVTVSYFWHYTKPAEHPPLSLIFKMPLTYAAYVLKYLGAICAQRVDGAFALLFGLAGVMGLAWAVTALLRSKRVDARALAPYLGMSAYSIGSALVTGLGRVGFGSDQALSSRYCTTTVPLWASLVILLFFLARASGNAGGPDSATDKRATRLESRSRSIAWAAIVFTLAVLALSSLGAIDGVVDISKKREAGRDALVEWAANPGAEPDYRRLSLLYPKPNLVLERGRVLVDRRLSIFRSSPGSAMKN